MTKETKRVKKLINSGRAPQPLDFFFAGMARMLIESNMSSVTQSNRVREQYWPLLRTLLDLCTDLCRALRQVPRDDVPKKFLLAFTMKATQTLRAIILLYENDLPQEVQSLVRVAFELRVTVEAFLDLLRTDPQRTCKLVLDSIMLEKVKQQRASDFKGIDLIPGAPTREDLEKLEGEIANRYSVTELKKLRKHGFSEMNVEQRAQKAGCTDLYNIVYRNFSRNVHSADITELLLADNPSVLREGQAADYFESRDAIGCDVSLVSCAVIAEAVNGVFRLGFRERLDELMARYERLKSKTR